MTRVNVQIRGAQNVSIVDAERVEEDTQSGKLIAKDAAGSVVGKFNLVDVVGWWLSGLGR